MKKLTIFFSLLFICFSAFAQINFYSGAFDKVLSEARAQERMLFVDVYTDWCGPCKWLSANHFQDEKVGAFFNEHFISFKINAEKGEGVEFAKKYKVTGYPTLLFLDGDGRLLHKLEGAPMTYKLLIELGENALNPEKQLFTLARKYETHNEDTTFLRQYARALSRAGEYAKANEVALRYFTRTGPEKLRDPDSWTLFAMTITDVNTDLFMQVFTMKEELRELHGEEVDEYFELTLDESIMIICDSADTAGYHKLKGRIGEMYPDKEEELNSLLDYRFFSPFDMLNDPVTKKFLSGINLEKAHRYAQGYLDTYTTEWEELNSIAWNYYEHVKDKDMLADAANWAKKSVAMDENYYNTDTYAHLLVKLRRWKEAKELTKKSIELGKAEGQDVSSTEKLLKKIK